MGFPFVKAGNSDVCEEENQLLRNAIIKLSAPNNSTAVNSCSTDEDCPDGHGWCDESGTCIMCSRACVETIIDAAMTCLDLIHHDDNACAWDIIIGLPMSFYPYFIDKNKGQ